MPMSETIELSAFEHVLLERYQRDFPVSPQPFQAIADELGTSSEAVLAAFERLRAAGALSRIGPVIRPHAIGASMLAAMAVPRARLESVAALISAYPEVNHNYERDHRFNLWFVLTGADARSLEALVRDIEARSGLPVLRLPMLASFHIDLGFALAEAAPVRP